MNDKTNKVFFGWLNLTAAEKQELEAAIRRFNTSSESEQRQVRESRDSVFKVITGPLGSSGSCPCCGR